MLENLLKTIVDESTMTDNAKVAFANLLQYMTQLQVAATTIHVMRDKSQQSTFVGFESFQGRWLTHEANLFSKASNL